MFQKKAPKGIEPDAGEEGQAPLTDVKRPKKSKKKKAKKTSVAKEGQKGKIAAMLGAKFAGKELGFTGKRGPANQFSGSNTGMTMGAKAGDMKAGMMSGEKGYC